MTACPALPWVNGRAIFGQHNQVSHGPPRQLQRTLRIPTTARVRFSEVAIADLEPRRGSYLLRDSTGGRGKSVVGIAADQAYGSDH